MSSAAQPHVRLLSYVLLAGIVATVVLYLLDALWPVLMPIFASLLIAYVCDPLIDWFEARRVNRTLAIVLVLGVLVVIMGALVMVVLPMFVRQFHDVLVRFPAWFDGAYGRFTVFAEEQLGYSADELSHGIHDLVGKAQSTAVRLLTGLGSRAGVLVNVLLVPVFVFYFLRDFDTLKQRPLALVPPRWRDFVIARARRVDTVVGHWVRGQLEVALILAVLYAGGLSLAGVRLGVIIGIVTGLLNIVPYVGAATGMVLSTLMVLVGGGGLDELGAVALVFAVVQVLEGYVLTPRLVGARVGLSPVAVIIALLVFGSLFGLLGLLLAVPTTAALAVILEDALRAYRGTAFFRGGDASLSPAPDASAMERRAEEA
jgi:predicted PurR-regulated permease PerM